MNFKNAHQQEIIDRLQKELDELRGLAKEVADTWPLTYPAPAHVLALRKIISEHSAEPNQKENKPMTYDDSNSRRLEPGEVKQAGDMVC